MTVAQLDLFSEPKLAEELKPPPDEGKVRLRYGHREIQIPLKKKRREAIQKFLTALAELKGKDIFIDSYDVGGRHFTMRNLKLARLDLDFHPLAWKDDERWLPNVIVLRGQRNAEVRIFTDYLVGFRVNDYGDYKTYLADFRSGLGKQRFDSYGCQWYSGYSCLHITHFNK